MTISSNHSDRPSLSVSPGLEFPSLSLLSPLLPPSFWDEVSEFQVVEQALELRRNGTGMLLPWALES